MPYDLSAFVSDPNDLFYLSWQKETAERKIQKN